MLLQLKPLSLSYDSDDGYWEVYDIVADYAETNNKYVLFADLSNYQSLTATKKSEIKTKYADYIPDDNIDDALGTPSGQTFSYKYVFFEFNSEAAATSTAYDWYPQDIIFTDKDYFIEIQVIAPNGTIPYTNLRLKRDSE